MAEQWYYSKQGQQPSKRFFYHNRQACEVATASDIYPE